MRPDRPPTASPGEDGHDVRDSLQVARELLRRSDGTLVPSRLIGRPPAFLLPDERRVAAAMCRAHNGLRSPRRRWQRNLVAALIGARMGSTVSRVLTADGGPRLSEPGALLEAIAQRMGTVPAIGIGLGRLDGYWKPVLHLVDRIDRRSIGFAKVGWTPLTRSLVDNEATMLEGLDGGVDGLQCPRLLHRFESDDLTVLITEPLPEDARRITDLPLPPTALLGPSARAHDLLGSTWWMELRGHVHVAPDRLPTEGNDVGSLFDELETHLLRVRLPMGRMHGDWVPWNIGRRPDGRLVAWDWEYGRPLAPIGIDMVHGRYQAARLLKGLDAEGAFREAHATVDPMPALLHAAMVVARRCWVASCGVATSDPTNELGAGLAVIRRSLGQKGPQS